jgi:hypothetical protein
LSVIQDSISAGKPLIYTGITRGKRLVVLVGQKRALAIAVKGKPVERRWSKLKERLMGRMVLSAPAAVVADGSQLPKINRQNSPLESSG